MLRIHCRAIPLDHDVRLRQLAEATEGYSGAELAAVCREAALGALEDDLEAVVVSARHFEAALAELRPRTTPDMLAFYREFERLSVSSKTA